MEVLEENSGMQKLSLEDVLEKFNIKTSQKDGYIDYILPDDECWGLDLFPYIVNDANKYLQAEVFYQKCLDGKISRQEFEMHEQKFHHFVKTLWLYDDVYALVNLDIKAFKRSHYAKKNRSKYKKHIKDIRKMMGDFNHMYEINSLKLLEAVLFLATREISQVLFYFKNNGVLLHMDGCKGLIYSCSEPSLEKLSDIAKVSQLYLLK